MIVELLIMICCIYLVGGAGDSNHTYLIIKSLYVILIFLLACMHRAFMLAVGLLCDDNNFIKSASGCQYFDKVTNKKQIISNDGHHRGR